jgi:hypothetical protein
MISAESSQRTRLGGETSASKVHRFRTLGKEQNKWATSMKKIMLLFLQTLIVAFAFAQCKTINYTISTKNCFSDKDTVRFTAKNLCKGDQFVLYSLEYKEPSGNWQEVDNDIYTVDDKGMQIITLRGTKKRDFKFVINSIDRYFFDTKQPVHFRIVENLYSKDKIEITQTKSVRKFSINCR